MALANVLARVLLEDARAGGVEGEVHRGFWVWLSNPGCASVSRSPVSTTCFLTSSPGHRARRKLVAEGHLAACAAASAAMLMLS